MDSERFGSEYRGFTIRKSMSIENAYFVQSKSDLVDIGLNRSKLSKGKRMKRLSREQKNLMN